MSIALGGLDEHEGALSHAREAVALAPSEREAMLRLGASGSSADQYLAIAYGSHAFAAATLGYWQEAYSSYLVARKNENNQLPGNVEQVLLQRKRLTDTIRDAGEVYVVLASSASERAHGHTKIGEGYRLFGRFAEAEAAYRRALEEEPDYAAATEGLRLAQAEDSLTTNAFDRPKGQ